MESERAPAAFVVAEAGSLATVSRCSATVASTAACQSHAKNATEDSADCMHNYLMLKRELLTRHDDVIQYVTKYQELAAMTKCLDDIRQQKDAKDHECRRLEQELKQTQEDLELSRKIGHECKAANARLVDINQRLSDEKNKCETSLKEFSDIVNDKDSQINSIMSEKVNAEQVYRAELEKIKRSTKKQMKKMTLDNGKVEKLAEELKESRAEVKFLKAKLKRNENELKESKKLAARVSAQLAACKAKLKHAQERRRVSADVDAARHEKVASDVASCSSSDGSDTSSNSSFDDVADEAFDITTSDDDDDDSAPTTNATANNVSRAASADEDNSAAVHEVARPASLAASSVIPSARASTASDGEKASNWTRLSDSPNAKDAGEPPTSLTEILQEVRQFPTLSPLFPASARKSKSRVCEKSGAGSLGVSGASRRVVASSSSSDDDRERSVDKAACASDDDQSLSVDRAAREIELQLSSVADFAEPGDMGSSSTSIAISAPDSLLTSRDAPPAQATAAGCQSGLTPNESDGTTVPSNDGGAPSELPFSSFTCDPSDVQLERVGLSAGAVAPQPCQVAVAQLSGTSTGLRKKPDGNKVMMRLELAKQERLQKQLRARHAVTACNVDLAVRHCERSRPVAPLSRLSAVDSNLGDADNQNYVGTSGAHLDNRSGAKGGSDRRDMLKQDSLGFEPAPTSVSLPLAMDDSTQRGATTDDVLTSVGCEANRGLSDDCEMATCVTPSDDSDCRAHNLAQKDHAASLHAAALPSTQSIEKLADVRCRDSSPVFGNDQPDDETSTVYTADGSHCHSDQPESKALPILAEAENLDRCGDSHANSCTASGRAADAVAAARTSEHATDALESESCPVSAQPNYSVKANGSAELDDTVMLASSSLTKVGTSFDDGARPCSASREALVDHSVFSKRAVGVQSSKVSPVTSSAAVPTVNVAEDGHATSDDGVSAALLTAVAAPRRVAQQHLVWLFPRTASRYDVPLSGQHESVAPESTGSAVLTSPTSKQHATVMPVGRGQMVCGTNVPETPVGSRQFVGSTALASAACSEHVNVSSQETVEHLPLRSDVITSLPSSISSTSIGVLEAARNETRGFDDDSRPSETAGAPAADAECAKLSSQEMMASSPMPSNESTSLAASIKATVGDLPEAARISAATCDEDDLTLQPKPATNSPATVSTALGTEFANNTRNSSVPPTPFSFKRSVDRTSPAPSVAVGLSSAIPAGNISPSIGMAMTDSHHSASLHCSPSAVVMPTASPTEPESVSSIVSNLQAKMPSPISPVLSVSYPPAAIGELKVSSSFAATDSTVGSISFRGSTCVASPAAAIVEDEPKLPSLFPSFRSRVRVTKTASVVASAGTAEATGDLAGADAKLSRTPVEKSAVRPASVAAPKADAGPLWVSPINRVEQFSLLSTWSSNGESASKAVANVDHSTCFASPESVTNLQAGCATASAYMQRPASSVVCAAVAREKELSASQDTNRNVVLCSLFSPLGVGSTCPTASVVDRSVIKEEVAAGLSTLKSCDLLPEPTSAGPEVATAPTSESKVLLASNSKDHPVCGSLFQSFSAAVGHPHTDYSAVGAYPLKSGQSLSVGNFCDYNGTTGVEPSKQSELLPIRSGPADDQTVVALPVSESLTMSKQPSLTSSAFDGNDSRIVLTPVTSHRPEIASMTVQKDDEPEPSSITSTCRHRQINRDSAESPKAGSFVTAGLAATVREPAPSQSAKVLTSDALCARPESRKSSPTTTSVGSDDSCCSDDNLVIVEEVPSGCLLPGDPDRFGGAVTDGLQSQVAASVGGARLLSRSPPAGASTASTLSAPRSGTATAVATANVPAASESALTPHHSTASAPQPSVSAACTTATPASSAASLLASSSIRQPFAIAFVAASTTSTIVANPATSLTAAASAAEPLAAAVSNGAPASATANRTDSLSCTSAAAALNTVVADVLSPRPSAVSSTPQPSLAFSATADTLDSDDDIVAHLSSLVTLCTPLSPLPVSPVRRSIKPASAAVMRPRAAAAAASLSAARASGSAPLATTTAAKAPLSTSSMACKRALHLAGSLHDEPTFTAAPMMTPNRASPGTSKRTRLDIGDDSAKSAAAFSKSLFSREARQTRDPKAHSLCTADRDRSTADLPCGDPGKSVRGNKRTAVAVLSPVADESSSDEPVLLGETPPSFERQTSLKAGEVINSEAAKPNEPEHSSLKRNGRPPKKKKTKVFNDDRAARRTHEEARGWRQLPRPSDQEAAASSGRTVVTYGDDDDPFNSAAIAGADLSDDSDNRLWGAEQRVASAARGRGRPVKSKEPGHLRSVGRGSLTAAASTGTPPLRGKSNSAHQQSANSAQKTPTGNAKQKKQKSKKKGKNARDAVCKQVALPYENQARYAEHEIRRYVLDSVGQVTVQELVSNLLSVVRQPEALLESVIKILAQSQEDMVSVIGAQCEQGTYSPPAHTKLESKVVVLLHFANQGMYGLTSTVLYQYAIDMLATAVVHSGSNDVTVLGRSSLCRVFASLCKSTDAYARARALVCDILTCGQPAFPALIVAIASSWPDLLLCSGEDDVYGKAFERIVMQKLKADSTRHVMFKQMLTILHKLCKWSAVSSDPTAMCSRMLCDAVKPGNPEKDALLRLLRPVAAQEPWAWIKCSLIMNLAWPKLHQSIIAKQPDSGSIVGPEATADLIAFLGSLCQRCPTHDPGEVKFVDDIMTHLLEILMQSLSGNKHQNNIPWVVQTRTFDVLLSLAPYSPNLVARAIRKWMTPNHGRIEHRVKDDVQSFWRAYPGAGAGESRMLPV